MSGSGRRGCVGGNGGPAFGASAPGMSDGLCVGGWRSCIMSCCELEWLKQRCKSTEQLPMEDCWLGWLGKPQSDELASLSATCRALADDAETTAAVWCGLSSSVSCSAMMMVALHCNNTHTHTIRDI